MKISIFGLGYVGAVSMACLARDGHELIGVDIDPDKLALIRAGKTPVVEEGMQALMRDVVASGRVTVTDDCAGAIAETDVSFVCVGTPSLPNGDQDLTALQRLAEQLGDALGNKAGHHTLVFRSTVAPGVTDSVVTPIVERHAGAAAGEGYSICFQPEFLREGSSIRDYDNPPITVVGGGSETSIAQLQTLFGHLPCKFVTTEIRTAEGLKYACNAFHALKVTFANEIGRVSQALGVDSHAVMELLCMDDRLNISPAYLRPGFAFGGSCLPKDLRALLYQAKRHDVELPMLAGVAASNKVHVQHAIDQVLRTGARNVGFLGLSFKSGTDDLRESPLVTMAERFIGKGLNLKIYDPEVRTARLLGANRRYIEQNIPHFETLMVDSMNDAVEGVEVIVVGQAGIARGLAELASAGQLVMDLAGLPDRTSFAARYQGVCW